MPGFFYLTFPWTSPQHRPQVTYCLSHSASWNEPFQPEVKCCFGNRWEATGSSSLPLRPYRGQLGQVWKGQGLTQETAAGVGVGHPAQELSMGLPHLTWVPVLSTPTYCHHPAV